MKPLKSHTLSLLLSFVLGLSSCASIPVTPVHSVTQRKSFVKIIFTKDKKISSTASGVIIHHLKKSSFILTAGHVCANKGVKGYVSDIENEQYQVNIVRISKKSDLCLVQTIRKINQPSSMSVILLIFIN